MKILLSFILIPVLIFGQTQIGSDIDGENAGDVSGWGLSLSSDGNTVAIGAVGNDDNGSSSGHVRIYRNISGIWTKVGNDIDGESAADSFGWSVALSSDGNIVGIAAPFNDKNGNTSGYVRVFENIGGDWSQIGDDIYGDFDGDSAGWSISLSSAGDIIAIGAPRGSVLSSPARAGEVKVYKNISGVWTQIGQDLSGEMSYDNFGWSLSLSGNGGTVAVGAPDNDGNGSNSGNVRIYENVSGTWTQIGNDIDGEFPSDQNSAYIDVHYVALSSDGKTVAIGAPSNDGNGNDSGHVRVYENIAGEWTQIGSDIDGEAAVDGSGFSVSLSSKGDVLAVGAIGNDGNGDRSGHVRIYQNISGSWIQRGNDIDGEASEDGFGQRVSLSSDGNKIAISSVHNDGNGNRSGHVRIYDLSDVLSINEDVLSQFNLYPNPVNEQLIIQLNQNFVLEKVHIYNNLGQFVSSTNKTIINVSHLPYGVYFVKIFTSKGEAFKRIIIE